MTKIKYAVVNNDERWVETPYFDTEQEAIDYWNQTTGENFADMVDYEVQGFNATERKEIARQPDV